VKIVITLVLNFVIFNLLQAEFRFNNEISTLINVFESKSSQKFHIRIDYKPKLDFLIYEKESFFIDSEFIGSFYYNYIANDEEKFSKKDGELYRGWGRISSDQSELRIGRQKINFGPAKLLRGLKWFDKIDPRDPQHNTSGVDAMLFRYYFLNNTNIWLWSILSDSKLKGNESIPSKKDAVEFGGRIQYPFEYCESALSFHSRKMEINGNKTSRENRIGFDARWDNILGYWTEISVGIFDRSSSLSKFSKYICIGADYTIPLWNSFYILAEHSFYSTSDNEFFSSDLEIKASALSVDYSLSMLSRISSIVFYNWYYEDLSAYLSYQLSFNYLDLFFSIFSNPKNINPDYDLISHDGISFQIRAIYNFDLLK